MKTVLYLTCAFGCGLTAAAAVTADSLGASLLLSLLAVVFFLLGWKYLDEIVR